MSLADLFSFCILIILLYYFWFLANDGALRHGSQQLVTWSTFTQNTFVNRAKCKLNSCFPSQVICNKNEYILFLETNNYITLYVNNIPSLSSSEEITSAHPIDPHVNDKFSKFTYFDLWWSSSENWKKKLPLCTRTDLSISIWVNLSIYIWLDGPDTWFYAC